MSAPEKRARAWSAAPCPHRPDAARTWSRAAREFPLKSLGDPPRTWEPREGLEHRETYRKDLSPRIQQIRISSTRKVSSSPQPHLRDLSRLESAAPGAPRARTAFHLSVPGSPSTESCRSKRARGAVGGDRGERLTRWGAAASRRRGPIRCAASQRARCVVFSGPSVCRAFAMEACAAEGGPLSRPSPQGTGASAHGREKRASPSRGVLVPSCRDSDFAPRMTSRLGSTTFGSSAARRGPVALRPDLAAGLPLSCHREGEGEYCDLAERQIEATPGGVEAFSASRNQLKSRSLRAVIARSRGALSRLCSRRA